VGRLSRREFTARTALGAGAMLILPRALRASAPANDLAARVIQLPDAVSVEFDTFLQPAVREGTNWSARDATVITRPARGGLDLRLSAPSTGVKRVRLGWRLATSSGARVLNDAWERGYGDLSWQAPNADRILPWYAVVFDGRATGIGVRTQPAALCAWRVSSDDIQLICDVRSGPNGVRLGTRVLEMATVVSVAGDSNETPFAVTSRLCRAMCASPRLPAHPVYGSNDWYVNYGNNSREQTLRDAYLLADLTAGISNRPYAVVDGGWQETGGAGGGPWDNPAAKFGDMTTLAREMKAAGVRPGLWLRLLSTREALPPTYFRPSTNRLLDPSVPEVIDLVTRVVGRATSGWGYELVKHDYSSEDVFGRWGNQMGEALYAPNTPGFHDTTRTTAEIITAFYRAVRIGAGKAIVIGCNTMSHLAAGLVDLQRTGDDTSGREWDRTKTMGVNTLAYRLPQNRAFYISDPDCAPITSRLPWDEAKQWLDAVSRSGTSLFVSFQPELVTGDVRDAVRAALRRASEQQPPAEPLDWLDTLTPRRWRFGKDVVEYHWDAPTSGNPIVQGWYADPEARVFGKEYWIFPTCSAPYNDQTFFDAFSSPDLLTWTKHPRIFDAASTSWVKRAVWAPSIVENDGWFYLFFGANDIQNDQQVGGLGVVRSRQSSGPFEDYLGHPLVDKFHNGAQPIDPFVFTDTDGTHYLIYGGWKHCNVAKLNADFTGLVPFADGTPNGPPNETTFKEITPEGYVEGSWMLVRNGKYYFMWSEGGWTGPDYAVAYAMGSSPLGPFQRIGKILQQDPKVATGAGHHSVLHAPTSGKWYIVYHRRPLGETDRNHRVVCIDEMKFDASGRILPVTITKTGVEGDPV
jgi:hypothetical protein